MGYHIDDISRECAGLEDEKCDDRIVMNNIWLGLVSHLIDE
jgi:hypothetical protein